MLKLAILLQVLMTIGLAGLSTAARKENRVQRLQAAYFVSRAQSPTEKCAACGFWTLFFVSIVKKNALNIRLCGGITLLEAAIG